MVRKIFAFSGFAITLCVIFSFTNKWSPRPVFKTIVVDPGHGGYDIGARGQISTEADVSLAIGLRLGKKLEAAFPDCKIVYTRKGKALPGNLNNLNEANHLRAQIANEARGDLFISIHCNSAGKKAGGWTTRVRTGYRSKKVTTGKGSKRRTRTVRTPIYQNQYVKNHVRGTETFIWAADRSGIKSGYINLEEGGENGEADSNIVMPDMSSPEARIRSQLYEKKYFTKSLMLATFVEEELVAAGRSSRGVKQRNDKGIWVLQATGMPSILVETGFITNTEEEKLINSVKGQEDIANSIVKAVKKYNEALSGK